jgi:arylsulfatase A-like enzyme
VPLIFAGPGIAEGAKCSQPAELLDIYPTLVELCGLPPQDGLEGHSLVPQLQSAAMPRRWPAITTHNHDNHAVRSEHWRYIRYTDGSEELYDLRRDPHEWTNLASDLQFAAVKCEHQAWLPTTNAKPAPGSQHRILTYENGRVNWEGEDIDADDLVPEL